MAPITREFPTLPAGLAAMEWGAGPTASGCPVYPYLADGVTAWPDLPEAIRAGIVAMVKASM